jgi:hypothetical protein
MTSLLRKQQLTRMVPTCTLQCYPTTHSSVNVGTRAATTWARSSRRGARKGFGTTTLVCPLLLFWLGMMELALHHLISFHFRSLFAAATHSIAEPILATATTTTTRFSPEIHQFSLHLLAKCGTTAYAKLAATVSCFPGLSTVQNLKGNVPNSDMHVIKSQLETMMLGFLHLKPNVWNYRGSLSMDAMYVVHCSIVR